MLELTYTKHGDYYLPNLIMPEQPEVHLGRYAEMRREYLKKNHQVIYYTMLTECELHLHLAEVEQRAFDMEQMLLKQMAPQEGLTEELKASDMMLWVQKMNNLVNRVREIVRTEVIYV